MESKGTESKAMIREFLQNLLTQKRDMRPFSDDTSLILGGRLDSIDTVDLVLFLETAFGVRFGSGGLHREQLDTVNAIDGLVNA
jgi:acyl carrier protein